MTYKDIKGLEKHSDLYKYFKTIEHGLNEYQKKLQKGKNNTRLLKSTVSFFFEILNTIVGEFLYKFPKCEVRSETGRLIMPTVLKIGQRGQLSGHDYELFLSLFYYGTIGGLQNGEAEELKLDVILNVYNNLLNYMPDFLRQFPEPGMPSASQENGTSYKDNCGEFKLWGKIVISVAVGAFFITAISSAFVANNNQMMDLEAQLSEVEEQIASITAEKEELEEKPREESEAENGEALNEELEEESDTNSTSAANSDALNGVCKASDGIWYYYENGEKQMDYTGFASNSNGKWYVENGKVTKEANGVFKDVTGAIGSKGSWYYVTGSKVQTDYTGLAEYSNSNGWWYITDGKVDRSYTGVATNSNGTWYVREGKVDFSYNGTYYFKGSVYSVKDGKAVETG